MQFGDLRHFEVGVCVCTGNDKLHMHNNNIIYILQTQHDNSNDDNDP